VEGRPLLTTLRFLCGLEAGGVALACCAGAFGTATAAVVLGGRFLGGGDDAAIATAVDAAAGGRFRLTVAGGRFRTGDGAAVLLRFVAPLAPAEGAAGSSSSWAGCKEAGELKVELSSSSLSSLEDVESSNKSSEEEPSSLSLSNGCGWPVVVEAATWPLLLRRLVLASSSSSSSSSPAVDKGDILAEDRCRPEDFFRFGDMIFDWGPSNFSDSSWNTLPQ